MYPNPAKDQTTIHFALANASHVSINVYDIRGKEMASLINADLKQGDYTKSLNTSSFSRGIYTVKIVTDKGAENIKLVVQ
jgi:hypothetical protein